MGFDDGEVALNFWEIQNFSENIRYSIYFNLKISNMVFTMKSMDPILLLVKPFHIWIVNDPRSWRCSKQLKDPLVIKHGLLANLSVYTMDFTIEMPWFFGFPAMRATTPQGATLEGIRFGAGWGAQHPNLSCHPEKGLNKLNSNARNYCI